MKTRRALGILLGTALVVSMALVDAASARVPIARLYVVHGVPGVTVDVCLNGDEVRSGLAYGGKVVQNVVPDVYNLKLRLAQPGNCTGDRILKGSTTLADGDNVTAVAWVDHGGARITFFANDVSATPADQARVTIRHTAFLPDVDVWANGATIVTHVSPGDSVDALVPEGITSVWLTKVGAHDPKLGPKVFELEAGKAYQVMFVGTAWRNARFVVIGQPVGVTAT